MDENEIFTLVLPLLHNLHFNYFFLRIRLHVRHIHEYNCYSKTVKMDTVRSIALSLACTGHKHEQLLKHVTDWY